MFYIEALADDFLFQEYLLVVAPVVQYLHTQLVGSMNLVVKFIVERLIYIIVLFRVEKKSS